MMAFIITIHVIACIALIGLVLIQRGRGGGLVESFSGVESMFGTKTSSFLTRATTILSIVFFITCLSLAIFSIRQSKSLMTDVKSEAVSETPSPSEPPVTEAESDAAQSPQTQAPVTEQSPVQEGEKPAE